MAAAARSAQQPWVVGAAGSGSSGSPCVRQAPRRLLPSPGLQQGFQLHRRLHQITDSQPRLLRRSGMLRRGPHALVRAQAQQPQQPPRRAESPGPGIAGRPRPPAAAARAGDFAIIATPDAPPSAASETSSEAPAPPPPQQEPPPPASKDEPEVFLLMVACGIGLATGAAIVAFNVAVHEVRDWIWAHQSLLASNRELLRNIAESELWPKVVFPPLVGGLLVGALGFAVGGYDDKPESPRAAQQGGSSGGGAQPEGAVAGALPASSSTSVLLEQWRLQVEAVLRPVSRAVAAAITLGTGEGPSHAAATPLDPPLPPRPQQLPLQPRQICAAQHACPGPAALRATCTGVAWSVPLPPSR